jgi:hypothetical protein
MKNSIAGPGEGVEMPEDVNVMDIRKPEESHGSEPGEAGLIVLWDGNGYDSNETWLMCHEDLVCNLEYWQ